jgi:hypothetical protein
MGWGAGNAQAGLESSSTPPAVGSKLNGKAAIADLIPIVAVVLGRAPLVAERSHILYYATHGIRAVPAPIAVTDA